MTRPPYSDLRALLPVLRPERRGMIVSYVVGTASALSLVALSVLTAWVVGQAVVDRSSPAPETWIVLAVLVLVRTVLTWQEMDVSHALAYRVLARLRMALFDSYARSVPGRRREHSGLAAAVAMDDIEKLEFFYAHTVAQLATSATVLAVSVTATTALLPGAGVVVLTGSLVVVASALLAGRSIRTLGRQEQDERSTLSAHTVDALGALREVMAYGLADRVVQDALVITDRTTALARRRELLTQLVTATRDLAVTAVVIGVITVSATAATSTVPRLSLAALPAVVALALAGVSATTDATTTLTQLHPLAASAGRVKDGIRRPPVVSTSRAALPLPNGPLGLRFSSVSFTYDDRSPVLSSWSGVIRPGEHVGLAGPSGAGKSTLIALAARLWDPTAGIIEVIGNDGRAVRLDQVDDESLRSAVAVVDQEATLFHGTVRENLLRGTHGITDHELEVALRQVGADAWVGLGTELGQGGLRLSGGQQARLCLARALARRPRILLVDEVTASLDPETERVISDVIAELAGTVVIASHRAETLERLDRVVRLGARGVVADGGDG